MRHLKIIQLFVLNLLTLISAQSQTVYTEPALPTADASVIVYFNAEGTPLENYNGNVYTHTGITSDGVQWQHVIGSWGNNSTQPQLTEVSANLYKLEMNPSIRDYYIAGTNEVITEMCFVFRSSSSPYIQTSPDIFVPVYAVGLNVNIIYPDINPYFVNPGESIEVSVEATQAQSISLYVDNVLVETVNSNSMTETIITSTSTDTKHWIKAVASGGASEAVDSTYYFVRGTTEVAALPAGVKDGINYIDDQTVTLVLHAPYKTSVFVFGDFSNWQIGTEFKLKRNMANEQNIDTRYWVTLSGLTSGEEYAFQYLIDEELVVADPYADKVLDPWNDSWIEEETYPNLKPYPAGITTNIVSVLQTGQSEYNWQNPTFDPPAVGKLVMYELLLRDFVEAHDFQTLKDTISYFKNLGINAIEIMPFSEFEGNSSWGYNPSFYFAPDKYYGTKEALKAFIDECHGNGIAVIMDMVLNHAYGQNVMARMYWDATNNRPASNNPWFNAICPHPPYCWGNDFNHESEATQAFVDRVTSYWITEYKIDGYRFDFTQGFTNSSGGPSYNSGRIALIKRMADEIWNIDPDTWVILEHWCDNSEEKELANYGCMLWGELNYAYNEATMGWNANSNFSWISHKARGWDDPHLVCAMENHDKERLMTKNILYGNDSLNYDIKDTTIALQRMELAGAFFFTVPGPKMTWQFGELGYDYWINYPGEVGGEDHRLDPKPIRWDYLNDYRRDRIHDVWQALIHLKQDHEAFSTEDFTLAVGGAFKKIHLNHNTMNVAIIGNFDVVAGTINPSFQHIGTWYNYFAGDSLEVINVTDPISLEPGEYRIYTDVKLAKPNIGLSDGGQMELEKGKTLIYPNPSDGEFVIEFILPDASNVRLNVLDINGRTVDQIVERKLDKGTHTYKWDSENFLPGIYLAELTVNGNKSVSKLVVK